MNRRAGSFRKSFFLLLLAIACAASSGCLSGTISLEQVDGSLSVGSAVSMNCPSSGITVSGKVLAPNGREPIARASVGALGELPTPFAEQVQCNRCGENLVGYTQTSSAVDGTFMLNKICPGKQNIILQVGRFRKIIELDLAENQSITLSANQTKMPAYNGEKHPADHAPHVAIVLGSYDRMECVLTNIGLSTKQMDFFSTNSNPDNPKELIPSFYKILSDLEQLKKYDIIFINCGANGSLLSRPEVRQNLEQYVTSGGKLYVTDWAYDWVEQLSGFAQYINFEPQTSGTQPERLAAARIGPAVNSLPATVRDNDISNWLQLVTKNAASSSIQIKDILSDWAVIKSTSPKTKVWVDAKVPNSDKYSFPGVRPMAVTFSPGTCGRVFFSSFHTHGRDDELAGQSVVSSCGSPVLSPQEYLLERFIFDLVGCTVSE